MNIELFNSYRSALERIALREAGPDGPQADFEMCKLIAREALPNLKLIQFPGVTQEPAPELANQTITQETILKDDDGTIAVLDVKRKPRTWRGTFYPSPENDQGNYNAKIKPGVEIRIFGHNKNHVKGPQNFNRTFKIGDMAEYDSFNMKYNGKIVGIGAKTVSILNSSKRKVMLDLYVFIDRNWDFDFEKSEKHNSEEMQYI